MFITSFLTFMTIGGFPSFLEDMKVCFACHLSIALLFSFFGKQVSIYFYAHRFYLPLSACIWTSLFF